MLNTTSSNIIKTPSLLSLPKPCAAGSDQTHGHLYNSVRPSVGAVFIRKQSLGKNIALATRTRPPRSVIKASAPTTTGHEKAVSVKAVVTVIPSVKGVFSNIGVSRGLDDIADLLGRSLLLELVSAELNPGIYITKYASIINYGKILECRITLLNFSIRPSLKIVVDLKLLHKSVSSLIF